MTIESHPPGLGKYLVGLAGTVSAGLTGIWLIVAPFALLYQPDDAGWVDATRVGVFTGVVVLLAAVAGTALLVADMVGVLRAAGVLAPRGQVQRRRTRRIAEAREEVPAEQRDRRQDTDVDLQQVLIPLAASLLKELQQQPPAQPHPPQQLGHADAERPSHEESDHAR